MKTNGIKTDYLNKEARQGAFAHNVMTPPSDNLLLRFLIHQA